MISIKTTQEISVMQKANEIVAEVLIHLKKVLEAGMTTMELDKEAEALILKKGAKPAFKGYRGYPCALCISINEEVVHGIPGKKRINSGDLVSLDMGVIWEGFFGDAAVTVPVGKVTDSAKRLSKVTEESLYKGIEAAKPGNRIHDIGAAVQAHCEQAGYSVVRDFVGHGIGRALHEEPQVPNFGARGTGTKIEVGMVLAIEPMVNEGSHQVRILDDGWTAVTADGKLSAHFEHSVAILPDGPVILSQLN